MDSGSGGSFSGSSRRGGSSRRSGGSSRLVSVLLGVALLVGLGLLLYPTISDVWNSYHQSRAIVSYAEQVTDMDDQAIAEMRSAAQEYNARLALVVPQEWQLSDEQLAAYEAQLSVTAAGIMGYVEIPSIDVSLPIYHGTSEAVLQEGVGHLEGSSLPVGGRSTHAVLSGHRGLPSARLFTDIDRLAIGDVFYLNVLGDTLAYEVDQILTVEPDQLDALTIQEGQDLCTLVTCTPYGINSHRLLVRGHRVPVPEQDADASAAASPGSASSAVPLANTAIVVALAVVALAALGGLVALVVWLVARRSRRRKLSSYGHFERRRRY